MQNSQIYNFKKFSLFSKDNVIIDNLSLLEMIKIFYILKHKNYMVSHLKLY